MTSAQDRARAAERMARDFNRQASAGGGVRVTIVDDSPGGAKGFDRVFVGLDLTLDALPGAFEAADPAIRAAFAANFKNQGARSKWPALRPSTVRERIRLKYPGRRPILRRTGDLRAHVLATPQKVTSAGAGWRLVIDPRPGMPKYAWLALGTRNMKARPMVVVTPEHAVKITSAMSRHLRTVAARNGLG